MHKLLSNSECVFREFGLTIDDPGDRLSTFTILGMPWQTEDYTLAMRVFVDTKQIVTASWRE